MWLMVYFDLPTATAKERKRYARFRKNLLQDGFTMLQYSVYVRHCASKESSEVHINHIETFLPEMGQVSILEITDKQYSNIRNYWGTEDKPLPPPPQQLELF